MSLLEALLTEGYRDPHDVYIALRADGQKGSGTMDDPYDGGTRFGPALSASLDCDRAEFVVDANGPLPGLQAGTQVTFSKVKGPAEQWFNGPAFIVTEILESRVFELGEPAHPFRCVVKSAAMPAQIPPALRRLTFEDNICDVYAFDVNSAVAPTGVTTLGYADGQPFMFPQLVFRQNVFRYLDIAPATPKANGGRSVAFGLYSGESALMEGNVVGLVDDYVMAYSRSRNVQAFNNVTPAGQAVPLTEDTSGHGAAFERRDTLENRIGDALVLSLL